MILFILIKSIYYNDIAKSSNIFSVNFYGRNRKSILTFIYSKLNLRSSFCVEIVAIPRKSDNLISILILTSTFPFPF